MNSMDFTGERMTIRSPAKINWTLRVLGRRDDGYHEIESLVAPVSLYDELTLTTQEEPGVEVVCDHADLPCDESNLIVKAARRLALESGVSTGVRLQLLKRIPLGGGLGGGSSNAAFTLLALNRLWRLHWPAHRLALLAAELGSDVPLFLHGGAGIMRGRGEHVEAVQLGWGGWIVLVFPGLPVATASVYQAWRPGESVEVDLERFGRRPANAAEWMRWTFNMLERPALAVCPQLKVLIEQLAPLAGRPVRVSGSGSTLFTAFDTEQEAASFAAAARRETKLESRLVQGIDGLPASLAVQ